MNMQEKIDNAMKAKRDEEMKTSSQLTLGEMILVLSKMPKEKKILLDFCMARPRGLDSWRGAYEELSIEYDFEYNDNNPTVGSFLRVCSSAVGETFEGYKGGAFVMGKTTPVWVANYGESGHTGVVGIRDDEYYVIIETAYISEKD